MNRNLNLLLGGQLVSQVGDKFHMLAVAFLVLKISGLYRPHLVLAVSWQRLSSVFAVSTAAKWDFCSEVSAVCIMLTSTGTKPWMEASKPILWN